MPVMDMMKGKNANAARGHMPVKRSINFANVGEKRMSTATAVVSIVLVVIVAALISKFAVIDRFAEVSRIQRENRNIQAEIDADKAEIERQKPMQIEYAHYTYDDMTNDERNNADRAAVMDLIRLKVSSVTPVNAWSISGNRLMMSITGYSLESVNNMVLRLQEDPLVDYCTVATASQTTLSSSDIQTEEYVVANVEVYLKNAERGLSAG